MQTITSANCPDERTRAIDARDSRTYWVQEMPDGKCWMLTNLAYAGGGTNAHGDVKILQNGTGDTARTYTEAKYYIPSGANVTAGSTNPSASTDGTGQYGYLYNYCAAAGVQVDTAACLSETTPVLSEDVSICPAGWRLPTGEAGGMFQALNNAVNQGRTNTDQGLREAWLAQSAGSWNPDFCNQGVLANYWSSFQQSGSGLARYMTFYSTGITPVANNLKSFGFSVRCVAV